MRQDQHSHARIRTAELAERRPAVPLLADVADEQIGLQRRQPGERAAPVGRRDHDEAGTFQHASRGEPHRGIGIDHENCDHRRRPALRAPRSSPPDAAMGRKSKQHTPCFSLNVREVDRKSV